MCMLSAIIYSEFLNFCGAGLVDLIPDVFPSAVLAGEAVNLCAVHAHGRLAPENNVNIARVWEIIGFHGATS